jgi:hypothetical protein
MLMVLLSNIINYTSLNKDLLAAKKVKETLCHACTEAHDIIQTISYQIDDN